MKLFLLTLLTLPFVVTAEPVIRVTSFVMNDSASTSSTSAEICGVITDTDRRVQHDRVVITTDPRRNPGYYVAHVLASGQFCHVISTLTREAKVEAFTSYGRRTKQKPTTVTVTK